MSVHQLKRKESWDDFIEDELVLGPDDEEDSDEEFDPDAPDENDDEDA